MSPEPEDESIEQVPPVGHVRVVYLGPVAPHWEVQAVEGDPEVTDAFRDRALARLVLLPPHDPQFRRNRERVVRDAERENLTLDWDLGFEEAQLPRTDRTGAIDSNRDLPDALPHDSRQIKPGPDVASVRSHPARICRNRVRPQPAQ